MRTLALLALLAAPLLAGDSAWSDEVMDRASHLPVQDHGRVKPLSTVADFALLRINHKRSFLDSIGRKQRGIDWALQVLFFPENARREQVFLIENHEVLDAVGLERSGKKRRDRYTYDDLHPARERIYQLGHEYSRLDAKKRNPVQGQVVHLAENFIEFERLLHFLDFARNGIAVEPDLQPFFDGRASVPSTEALAAFPRLARGVGPDTGDAGRDELIAAIVRLEEALQQRFGNSDALALLPPTEGDVWLTPRDLVEGLRVGVAPAPEHIAMLALFEEMVAQRGSPPAFLRSLTRLQDRARERDEYGAIALEVSFYRLDPFYRSLVLFLLAFLLIAVSWIRPGRWLPRAAIVVTTAGLALTATGIVLRCVLRGRPPVSTLYETVLFITAVAVLASLVIEAINRRRIALAAAPILGVLGLFIANRFEEINRADTMPQLVAVLDTNFWLATHVVCITIGYAAGLLAGAIGHVYVLGRILGLKRGDTTFYRSVARMVYGVICFGLLFSVIGTILGGVWANESWGRFWGWDPKENGALLICLAQLALLHGRMGGYLRDLGVCMAAVFVGIVVSWSWWGVNLLGVGLHSYGFTGGVWTALLTFWGIEAFVLTAGFLTWLRYGTVSAPA